MKISLNWLKEFIDFEMSPEELDSSLTMLGIEVEAIENPAKKYDGFGVALVEEKTKHPDADKLSICKVNTGNEILQVICGAPNVEQGQKVVLGQSGAIVPSGGFKLEKRKIRGVESNGMICSQIELELGNDSDGIWVLPDDAPIGTDLAEFLGINDVIFEISVTPNRADCLSHIGIAREISALLSKPINYTTTTRMQKLETSSKFADIKISDNINCLRYTAMLVRNCKIGPSPDWLQKRMLALGLRPVNSAVDITNLVLMESGQPLHGFDFDKISGAKIEVRKAVNGEKFTTLDTKERITDGDMLMICDSDKPIAIAGVMGGLNSEITDETTTILIESAYFNPSSVRRTSKKLGLQSDSSYRFERGVDIDNVDKACVRAAELIAEICGGIVEEGIIDVYPDIVAPKQVKLRYERVSKIIGLNFTAQEIKNLLERLNFVTVSETDEELIVKVPSYRVDIEQEIDLIEEVARLYNYDNIESDFSSNINFGLSKMLPELSCPSERNQIRNYMSSRGFTEILTQNQTDPKSVQTMQIEPVRITNPLGEELSLLRTSLIPSVLKVISHNIRNGTSDLKLFEVGKCFAKNDSPDNFIKGISEYENLIVALTGLESPLQWSSSNRAFDFYDIKGICEDLIGQLNLKNIKFNTLTEHPVVSKNSMSINFKKQQIGIFGELRKNLAKQYDIEQAVFIFVLNLSQVYKLPKSVTQYTPVSHYPAITRDLAFILSSDISAGDVASTVINTGGELLRKAVLFDVYKDEKLGGDRKSLAFGLTFRAQDRTLKETEIENIVKNIIKKVEVEFSAQLRTN